MRLSIVSLVVLGLCQTSFAASGAPPAETGIVVAQNELSSKSAPGGGSVEVELCNRSAYGPLFSAIAYYKSPEDEDITIKGWYKINKGECKTFYASFGRFQKIKFGYYAEWEHGRRMWPAKGDWNLCIEKEKAFERYNSDNYTCKSREKLVEFDAITVERDQPSRTVNLR